MKRSHAAAAIAAIALLSAARIASTYRVFSQTVDEPVHVSAGLQWLTSGNLNVDPEHPPLARIAVALIPYLEGTRDVLAPGPCYRHDLFVTRIGNLPFFLLAGIGAWELRLAEVLSSGSHGGEVDSVV